MDSNWALGIITAPGITWNWDFPNADPEPTEATKPTWGLPLRDSCRPHVKRSLGCVWDQHLGAKRRQQDWFKEEVGLMTASADHEVLWNWVGPSELFWVRVRGSDVDISPYGPLIRFRLSPGREHSLGRGSMGLRSRLGNPWRGLSANNTVLGKYVKERYHCVHDRTLSSPQDFSAGRAGRIVQWFKRQNVAVKSWKLEKSNKCSF